MSLGHFKSIYNPSEPSEVSCVANKSMEGNDTVDLTSYKNGGAENKILLQN